MQTIKNKRSDILDYAKGIGIILVVYGHLLSSAFHKGFSIPSSFFYLSDSIVYSFHIPLFFFIAGFLANKSFEKKGIYQFLSAKIKFIVYPYLVWSALQMGVELFFQEHTNKSLVLSDIIKIFYEPWAQFWFLYALLFMYLIFAIAKTLNKISFPIISIIAVFLFFFPISSRLFAFGGFSKHFLFFILGFWYQRYLIERVTIAFDRLWFCLISSIMFFAMSLFVFTQLIDLVRLSKSAHPVFFFCLACAGMATVFIWSHYLAEKGKLVVLKRIGYYTLPIYLVHMLAGVGTRFILLKFFHIEDIIVHMSLGTVVALFGPIVLYFVLERCNFPYLFSLVKEPKKVYA